jgi:hypothetical protein
VPVPRREVLHVRDELALNDCAGASAPPGPGSTGNEVLTGFREARGLCGYNSRMARYLQKISLRPYSDSEIWTGWELEGREGEVEGLILAEGMSEEKLVREYGVTEFQKIPSEYLDAGEFRPKTQ